MGLAVMKGCWRDVRHLLGSYEGLLEGCRTLLEAVMKGCWRLAVHIVGSYEGLLEAPGRGAGSYEGLLEASAR